MKTWMAMMVLAAGTAAAAEPAEASFGAPHVVGTEVLENGYKQTVIDCSGPEAGWGDCYKLAKEACDGRGYSIVDRAERMRAEVQVQSGPAGVVSSTSSQVTRVLTMSCATR